MNGKINEKMRKRQGREAEEIGINYFSYYLFFSFFYQTLFSNLSRFRFKKGFK